MVDRILRVLSTIFLIGAVVCIILEIIYGDQQNLHYALGFIAAFLITTSFRLGRREGILGRLEGRFEGLESRFEGLRDEFRKLSTHVDEGLKEVREDIKEILRRFPPP
jgi:hypothetical protein